MPSSPDTVILSVADIERAATVTTWQPMSLADKAPTPTTVALPTFEERKTAVPSTHAFAISHTVGIPADLLAAETAAARAAGYADGYATGIARARAATEEHLAARIRVDEAAAASRAAAARQAFEALFDAATELERLAAPSAAEIEEQIVASAWTIAEAVIGQVLADDEVRGPAAIARALSLAPTNEDVTVAMSPVDFRQLTNAGDDGSDSVSAASDLADLPPIRRTQGLRTITIVPDESLAAGDAVATCNATTIDARLSAAIERVRQVLAP
jgi:flagellar assembly protein FliH